MSDQTRVRMIKTLAPVEIPNGTEGTVIEQTVNLVLVRWDNDYVLPMYRHEVEVICAVS